MKERYVMVNCYECKKPIIIPHETYEATYGEFFCSKHCVDVYINKEFEKTDPCVTECRTAPCLKGLACWWWSPVPVGYIHPYIIS